MNEKDAIMGEQKNDDSNRSRKSKGGIILGKSNRTNGHNRVAEIAVAGERNSTDGNVSSTERIEDQSPNGGSETPNPTIANGSANVEESNDGIGIENSVTGGSPVNDDGGTSAEFRDDGNRNYTAKCTCGKQPGTRGRHRKGCAKAKSPQEDSVRPITVNSQTLNSPPPKNNLYPFQQATINRDALTEAFRKSLNLLWQGAYQIPVLMGYGTFWALSEPEARILTEQSEEVINSVPSEKRKAVMNALNTYIPIVSLFSAVAVITYPRYATMIQLREATIQNGRNNTTKSYHPGETEKDNSTITPQHEHPSTYLNHDSTPVV